MKPIPEYRRPVNFPPKKANGTTAEHAEQLLKRWRETGWALGIYHPIKRSKNKAA